MFKLLVVQAELVDVLLLDNTIHTILAIYKLDKIAEGFMNSSVIANHDVFQCLNQTSLDIPSLSCFHGSIDKNFATSHSMEEELLWCQAMQI